MVDYLSPASSPSDSFVYTQKLLRLLPSIQGINVNLNQIRDLNAGVVHIITGLVVSRFKQNGPDLKQVTLQTSTQGRVILVDNTDVASNEEPLGGQDNFAGVNPCSDIDLTTRPSVIQVNNLQAFQLQLQSAAQFGQLVTCIYSSVTRQITLLSIHPKDTSQPVAAKSHDPTVQKPPVREPYPIEVRFRGPFSVRQRFAFELAASRWGEAIHDSLPPARVNGEVIAGLVITAMAIHIDGPNQKLAQSRPLHLRSESLLPATGVMEFDTVDLGQMEANGTLVNVIMHEIGHVLGFGTLWERMGLLQGVGSRQPTFIGRHAMDEFGQLMGLYTPTPVPIENIGAVGTRNCHWRDSIFGNELMTGFLNSSLNPMSRMTIAAFQDMGYSVNRDAADVFVLPGVESVKMGNVADKVIDCQCQSTCGCGRQSSKPIDFLNTIFSN